MRRLIALVSLLVAVDLAMWSAIVPLLPYYRSELGLTKVESGWLVAAFSIAVVATSVPLGHLADRIGARRVVAAGAVAMAVATLGLGFAGSFWRCSRPAPSRASATPRSGEPGWRGWPPGPPSGAAARP